MRSPSVSESLEAHRLIDQGAALLNLGEAERAASSFKVSYELAPSAAALDGLGCAAFISGDLGLAEVYFVQAYQMDRDYHNSLANLAMLYEMQGRLSEADRLHKYAIESNPTNFRARNNFGVFLSEYKSGSEGLKPLVKGELLKAEALADDPLIIDNIEKLERGG